jgi:hypothetical protein
MLNNQLRRFDRRARRGRRLQELVHRFAHHGRAEIGETIAEGVKLTAMRACLLVALAVTATCGLASCGGNATPTTPVGAPRSQPSAAELLWRRQVRAFAAGIAAELRRIQAGTGGGPKTGPIGARIDPGVLAGGPRRRSFVGSLAALESCPRDVAREVPRPPASPLVPVRTALAHACTALASAARSLRRVVAKAGAGRPVDPGALAFARGQAEDGVRLVVDALAILARVPAGSG